MFFSNTFDGEIIDDQCKHDGAMLVSPQSGGALQSSHVWQGVWPRACWLACRLGGVRTFLSGPQCTRHRPIHFVAEVAFINDFVRHEGDVNAETLMSVHRCIETEVLHVGTCHLRVRVDSVLLIKSLAISRSAVLVPVSPGQSIKLPPTVKRVRFASSF